ncbi:MAG: transglycosylase SLT domain-containing protein, partial [Actinomycetota bacterium]|nr:transglycosylase SLT domain-containing protein [Actinomycetota bacterium]
GPTPSAASHRLKRGETLSGVAQRFGVSVGGLAGANGIDDIDRVQAGTRLVVPGPRRTAGPASAPGERRRPAAGRLPERLRQQPQRLALVPRFEAEARRYGVAPDLLKALTWLESGWQNDKVSPVGALGIGQLMPDTVRFLNEALLPVRLDPRRADHNIRMSARFLAYLLHQCGGDVDAAVASYYQGLASVRRIGPIPETRNYVDQVRALRAKF